VRFFANSIVGPYVKASGYRRLCEVGSALGENIDRLLAVPDMSICCIDPGVLADLVNKYAGNPRIRVCKGLSLDELAKLDDEFDCIMIDGDHNWYTVYHELKLIHAKRMLAKDGTLFLHDVCWPYARRDMYYDVDTVPAEFRHPAKQAGMLRGKSALVEGAGKNPEMWNAVHEGGPKNGVLTAVDDFLCETPGYTFFRFEQQWGLGVLLRSGENRPHASKLQRKARMLNAAERIKTALKSVAGRMSYVER
jgi:hypothetical protein